ncbi:unnamed protein product [Leptidea sinapis]|uniref:Uncharacterized protein n=1 Tax=Leptidea sinapis TaxID=189913 RepID=A0A5E4PWF4_9NEOP|nr:unnamed protein product [Leptidea sinapis]
MEVKKKNLLILDARGFEDCGFAAESDGNRLAKEVLDNTKRKLKSMSKFSSLLHKLHIFSIVLVLLEQQYLRCISKRVGGEGRRSSFSAKLLINEYCARKFTSNIQNIVNLTILNASHEALNSLLFIFNACNLTLRSTCSNGLSWGVLDRCKRDVKNTVICIKMQIGGIKNNIDREERALENSVNDDERFKLRHRIVDVTGKSSVLIRERASPFQVVLKPTAIRLSWTADLDSLLNAARSIFPAHTISHLRHRRS